jgi:cell division transport system ATP-binding protein
MIELENVTASYELPAGGRRVVLRDVSLRIEQGEMLYLVGPSGCGKSTLLKLLYMDKLPDEGRVIVNGFDSSKTKHNDIPMLRRSMGVVFQDFQLLADRNVLENVAFTLYVTGESGRNVQRKALSALSRVGLSYKRRTYPHELSGGEQQRVCIARAIVNDTPMLLADEPTGNLDPSVAAGIVDLLTTLNQQGMTVIMATHNYHHVKRFPAKTLAFWEGKLREIDPSAIKISQTA